MGHLQTYTRQRCDIFEVVGNFATKLILNLLRSVLDVDGLFVVEAYFLNPVVQSINICLHNDF